MADSSTRTIFPTVGTQVDSLRFSIIGCYAIISSRITSGEGQRVHVCHSQTGNGIKPVRTGSHIGKWIRNRAVSTIFFRIHNVQLFLCFIEGDGSAVSRMHFPVTGSFFQIHKDHTVATPRTVDSGSGTVFQHIDRFNIGGIDIRHITSRHSVYNNQRAQPGITRRYTTNLDTSRTVRIGQSRIGNRYTGYFSLQQHGSIETGDLIQVFRTDMRNSRGHFFPFHRTITHHYHFIQRCGFFFQHDFQ